MLVSELTLHLVDSFSQFVQLISDSLGQILIDLIVEVLLNFIQFIKPKLLTNFKESLHIHGIFLFTQIQTIQLRYNAVWYKTKSRYYK